MNSKRFLGPLLHVDAQEVNDPLIPGNFPSVPSSRRPAGVLVPLLASTVDDMFAFEVL